MGGKVLARSCNASNRTVLAGRCMSSMHAEMMVLSFAFRNKSLPGPGGRPRLHRIKNRNRKLDLYVVRLGCGEELVCSKPCGACIQALKRTGVKRVFYSVNGGGMCMEKVCDMTSNHVSFFQDTCRMCEFPAQKIRF